MDAIVGDTAAAVDEQGTPAFTADDELRELQSLTVKEITDVEKDLLGVTAGVGGLRMDAWGKEHDGESSTKSAPKRRKRANVERPPPPPRRSSLEDLASLEQHLLEMPLHAKESYIEACLKCPELLTPEHKSAFLEHDDFDARKAAARLCEYWEVRVATFGPERAFLPMTLAGALKDEVQGMIKYCPWYLLPDTDLSGRKILFLDTARRDFANFSEDREARSLFYLLDIISFDPSTRSSGWVFVSSAQKLDRKSFSFRIMKYFRHLIDAVAPITFRGSHICWPSPVFYYVISPVMRRVLGKKYRLRMKLHYGNEAAVIQSLEKYRFSKARLPKVVGGFLELNYGQWVAQRSIVENLARASAAARQIQAEESLSTRANERASSTSAEAARAHIVSQFNKSLLALSPETPGDSSNRPASKLQTELTPSLSNDDSLNQPDGNSLTDGGLFLAQGKRSLAAHTRELGPTNTANENAVTQILDKLPSASDELDRFFQDQDFDEPPQIGGESVADADIDEMLTNMFHDGVEN